VQLDDKPAGEAVMRPVSRRWFLRTRSKPATQVSHPAHARQHGQALLEFALVLPLFLLGFFGLIDGARLVYLNSTLSQAAREGARTASVEAAWIGSTDAACGSVGGPVCPGNADAFRADVVSAVNRMMTPFASIGSSQVYISCDATTPPTGSWQVGQSCVSAASGSLVSVRVVYTFSAVTPVVGQILGNVALSGAATMVIN
jgi:hypothetical protein